MLSFGFSFVSEGTFANLFFLTGAFSSHTMKTQQSKVVVRLSKDVGACLEFNSSVKNHT